MALEDVEDTLAEALRADNYREFVYGRYHPSTITGCPLKGFLNKMVDSETRLNNYLFQGSAVHFYLQKKPSLLNKALREAGYHPLDIDYEVHKLHEIEDGITLTGTCDILAGGNGSTDIIDIKYSSVRPETHKGRIFQYMSQVNTYAHMFGADRYGLLLIYSYANDRAKGGKPTNIPDSLTMLEGEKNQDNWEITRNKARQIHTALGEAGYPDGERWTTEGLADRPDSFWDDVRELINLDHAPSYEKECDYCDHSDYCPVYNSGLKGMGR